MSMRVVRASRKEHRCDECGRLIPVGAKYWRDYEESETDRREHTNCMDFVKQPALPLGFNSDRSSK